MTPLSSGTRKISYTRVIAIVLAVSLSLIATVLFGDKLNNNTDVLSLIATIFSILAGVLIAVISILGDPSMLIDQSWRHSYISAGETQRKIHRQTDLFVLYILQLAALFIFMLTEKSSVFYIVIQHVAFFLTVLGFFASLALPFTLRGIQKERLDKAIKLAKSKESAR